MKRIRALLLALLLIVIVLPLPTHGDMGDCSGAPPIRLAIGITARTAQPEGAALYANPGERFRKLAKLRSGTTLQVVSGPTCSDSMQWWQVRGADGLRGWLPEGDEALYQLEPWPVSVDIIQRSGSTAQLMQIAASDASRRVVTTFKVAPVSGGVHDVFPPSESGPFEAAFSVAQAHCPALLRQSDPAYATLAGIDGIAADRIPADSGALDTYPSPDGLQLLVVRHMWRGAVACTADPLPVYGVDRLSLITTHSDVPLLDIPANAPSPIYLDRYPYEKQETSRTARSRIENVQWAPDSKRVLLTVRYADFSGPDAPVFTYKLLIYHLRTGQVTELGDGRLPSWDATGDRVQWFRLIRTPAANPSGTAEEMLYTANADGTDLRSIPLPSEVSFLAYPALTTWDALGQRVLGCIQATQITPQGCAAAASFNLLDRRVSPPLPVDAPLREHGYRQVQWLSSNTLLWLPADPASTTLYVQSLLHGDVKPLRLQSSTRLRLAIADAQPFADGKSVLVHLRDTSRLAASYLVVDTEAGQVRLTTP